MSKTPKPQVNVDGVWVPQRVGGGYTPIKVVPLSYIYGDEGKNHRRLHVFHHKGIKCVTPGCNRQGYYVIYGRDRGGSIHIDLYTKDFVLMTVDHIHPKSKGGSNLLHNKQPMCERCNSKKGSLVVTPAELAALLHI